MAQKDRKSILFNQLFMNGWDDNLNKIPQEKSVGLLHISQLYLECTYEKIHIIKIN